MLYLKLKHQFVGSLLLMLMKFPQGPFKSLSISTMQFVIDFTPLLTFAHTQYMPWWQLVLYQVPICLGFGKFIVKANKQNRAFLHFFVKFQDFSQQSCETFENLSNTYFRYTRNPIYGYPNLSLNARHHFREKNTHKRPFKTHCF